MQNKSRDKTTGTCIEFRSANVSTSNWDHDVPTKKPSHTEPYPNCNIDSSSLLDSDPNQLILVVARSHQEHLRFVQIARGMAEGTAQSKYVKLTKEQTGPVEDIQPGELNQPMQLPGRKCHECGQTLPETYQPPGDEPWTTGIFGCAEDTESCWTGLFCPCVLFGRNVENLSEDDTPWTRPCICHAIFIEGGLALAVATSLLTGVIDPGTTFLITEGLLFSWWMCGVYTGLVRTNLQKKYHLSNAPCDPCMTHCCLHWCALCQEHREMKGRLAHDSAMPMTIINPPPIQEMTSTTKSHDHPTSSSNGTQDGNAEIQTIQS